MFDTHIALCVFDILLEDCLDILYVKVRLNIIQGSVILLKEDNKLGLLLWVWKSELYDDGIGESETQNKMTTRLFQLDGETKSLKNLLKQISLFFVLIRHRLWARQWILRFSDFKNHFRITPKVHSKLPILREIDTDWQKY